MNLKDHHKTFIVNEILSAFKETWATLVYDKITYGIIMSLFSKYDLLDYSITSIHSIEDKKVFGSLPTIYFVSCSKEIGRKITEEFKSNREKQIKVFTLCKPEGLDPSISYKVVDINIEVKEERVFKCDPYSILGIQHLISCCFNINYTDPCAQLAKDLKVMAEVGRHEKEAVLLIFDRKEDLYTPLMHFFSFRTLMSGQSSKDLNDEFYPKIKNLHVGDVGAYIQTAIKKLKEDLKLLDSQNLGLETLSSLVFDAPKNIETKKNIEKYSNYLNISLSHVENIRKIVEAEQDLVLERDKYGNSIVFDLNTFFDILHSAQYSFEEKRAFLYLLKMKAIRFTENEKKTLISKGFKKEDIEMTFDMSHQLQRSIKILYKYDISRFEPLFLDAVDQFLTGGVKYKNLKISSFKSEQKAESLRKSKMIAFEKNNRKIVVVYVRGGLTIEELKIPYILSERLGAEVFIGSDKIFKETEFVQVCSKKEI